MDEEATKTASDDKRNEERIVETNTSAFPVETSSALLLGGFVCLALMCGLLPVVLGVRYYQRWLAKKANQKLPSPSLENDGYSKEVLMKMKDLQISVNLSPVSSGYAKARGRLYGRVAMSEESTAVYEEPFNRPVPSPGYYTFDHILTPSEAPLKCPLPSDSDDSVEYAVPHVETTPPPPFSEVCVPSTLPPPLPIPPTQPPVTLPTVHGVQYTQPGVLHYTAAVPALEHRSCNWHC